MSSKSMRFIRVHTFEYLIFTRVHFEHVPRHLTHFNVIQSLRQRVQTHPKFVRKKRKKNTRHAPKLSSFDHPECWPNTRRRRGTLLMHIQNIHIHVSITKATYKSCTSRKYIGTLQENDPYTSSGLSQRRPWIMPFITACHRTMWRLDHETRPPPRDKWRANNSTFSFPFP